MWRAMNVIIVQTDSMIDYVTNHVVVVITSALVNDVFVT